MTTVSTIQKFDRAFSVVRFAWQLKPEVFYATNYKRWVGSLNSHDHEHVVQGWFYSRAAHS
jgi:hypothetical protein